jgi:hypothetical protein
MKVEAPIAVAAAKNLKFKLFESTQPEFAQNRLPLNGLDVLHWKGYPVSDSLLILFFKIPNSWRI